MSGAAKRKKEAAALERLANTQTYVIFQSKQNNRHCNSVL